MRILSNKKPQPCRQATKVVAGGREHGADGVAAGVGKVIAAHAVVVLEVADHGSTARASCSWYFARSGRLRRRAFSVHWLCCSGVTSSSCPTRHGVRQSQDAMSQHGAHMREVERPL